MNKTTKIVIAVAVVAVVAIAVVLLMNSKPKTNLDPITSNDDLSKLVDKINEGLEDKMPYVGTQVVETEMIEYHTGLKNFDKIDYAVVSDAMMTAQAHSLVLVKVKDGVNVEEVAKEMHENINARKWVCVSAEKVYTTSSGDVVCLVMSNAETAKVVYEKFKTLAGTVGQEHERTVEDGELPEDMFPAADGEGSEDMLPAEDGEVSDDMLPAADPVE